MEQERLKVLYICNTDGALYVFRGDLIRGMIAKGWRVSTASPVGGYGDKLKGLGAEVHEYEVARHSSSASAAIRELIALYRLIRAVQPDIVHNFTHRPAIYGTVAAYAAGVRPIFVTISGLGALFSCESMRCRLLRWLLRAQYRIALRFARVVFFQNPEDLTEFVDRRLVREKRAVLTAGSGINLSEYRLPDAHRVAVAREELGNNLNVELSDQIVVLFAARGIPEKGVREFYEAARLVSVLDGRFVFVHCGVVEGRWLDALGEGGIEAYAQRCGVHYLGYRQNVLEIQIASDVFALPSFYREGVPRSLIEGLALGKWIITTEMPGCKETVIDGWNGALVPLRDERALAAKILAIDRDGLIKARGRSRALCELRFDVRGVMRATFESYLQGTEKL